MARSTTITLTAGEAAMLFSIVSNALDFGDLDKMGKGERRVAIAAKGKLLVALINTQAKEGS